MLWHFVRDEKEKFSSLLTITPEYIGLLVLVWVLLSIPRNLIRKLMAQCLGVRLAFVDWYGLSMVSNLMSLVMPARADIVFSSVYLKKKYGLPISYFGSMIYGNAILLAIIYGLEGLLGLVLLYFTKGIRDWKIWAIMAGLAVCALPFALASQHWLKGNHYLVEKIRAALRGWEILRSTPKLFSQLVILVIINSLIFTLWMYVSYQALGFQAEVIPVFLAGIVTQISFFATLTPGNLGIREALVGFVSQATGLGFTEGVAITLLQRAVSSVVFLVMGIVFGIFLVPSLASKGQIPVEELEAEMENGDERGKGPESSH